MKKLFHSLYNATMAVAIAALTFTSCDDVPMPYNQPNITPDEPTVEVEPAGSGTAADPYNVAAILQKIEALTGENTTETVYVKGAVSQIVNIETEQYGNANYYITDNGSNKVYIFQSYYLGNRKFTASDKLEVGDTVVVCGKFYNYNGNTPETVGKGTSYIYSLNGQTSGGTVDPTPGTEAKGDGTQANPYNATGAIAKAQTLSASDKLENVYVSGIVSSIKEVDTGTYGNASYYISEDGKTTGDQFYVFRGYYLGGDKFTSADQLKVGQKVTVCGNLINYYGNTPEMAQGNKIVSIDGSGETPETPDTPATSEYLSISGTTVTITNTGATAGDETASFDFGAQGWDNAKEVTEVSLSDGTKITFDGNGQKNTPKYYTGTKGVRVYLNNIIKFSGVKKIAKIVMACDAYNGTDYVGNAAATVTFDGNNVTYTNSDPSVTTGGGVQLRVKTITITYAK